jgi:hypothetical protein
MPTKELSINATNVYFSGTKCNYMCGNVDEYKV